MKGADSILQGFISSDTVGEKYRFNKCPESNWEPDDEPATPWIDISGRYIVDTKEVKKLP